MHTCGRDGFVNSAEQDGEEKQIVGKRRRRITREEVAGKVIKAAEQIKGGWGEMMKNSHRKRKGRNTMKGRTSERKRSSGR